MPAVTRSQDPSEIATPPQAKNQEAMAKPIEPSNADLLAEFKKGNAETLTKVTAIESSITSNQKVVEDYIKKNDEVVQALQGRVSTLEVTVTTLETTINSMSTEIETLKTQAKEQRSVNERMEKAEKQSDEDRRRPNLIIEGLTEDKNTHPRQQISALLADIGVTIPPESILTVSRLGPVTKLNSRRPRNILVKFNSLYWKQEIFKNIIKSKDSEKWKGVHIQDDLPQEVLEQRRDMRCLAALAREKGHRASLRGGALVVDEVRYSFNDIGDLPNGITLENAKLVKVEDGWAFQSHHAFPSSMFQCKIKHKGHDFHCVEQAYFFDMAEEAGDQRAAAKLRECKNGYQAKRIGEKIKKPEGWNDRKFDISAALHEKKFAQNETLKQRLIGLQGKLYEATRDEFFGAVSHSRRNTYWGKNNKKAKTDSARS